MPDAVTSANLPDAPHTLTATKPDQYPQHHAVGPTHQQGILEHMLAPRYYARDREEEVIVFDFRNLDPDVRRCMLMEIDRANSSNNIYNSARFNATGTSGWLDLLKEAAKQHNEHWLSFQLESRAMMKDLEGSHTPSGGYTTKHVPHTASITFAEGQFNRFYILGLCVRAGELKIDHLVVYRAKAVSDPRADSEALIGKSFSTAELLADLRETKRSFGNPLVKPNSGLSVQLPT